MWSCSLERRHGTMRTALVIAPVSVAAAEFAPVRTAETFAIARAGAISSPHHRPARAVAIAVIAPGLGPIGAARMEVSNLPVAFTPPAGTCLFARTKWP